MKKYFTPFSLLLLLLLCTTQAKAQYVTIPDSQFVNWLEDNGYGGCLVGNQLDTTCSDVVTTNGIDCSSSGIVNLEGIQYFDNLKLLKCESCGLTALPLLPSGLHTLDCSNNNLITITNLPNSLTYLNCSFNEITSIATLPDSLVTLYCGINNLVNLPALPSQLGSLICHNNELVSLPALPATLYSITCSGNQLTQLPALPLGLHSIDCKLNQLSELPILPPSLSKLTCSYNELTSVPPLPDVMEVLLVNNNTGLLCLPPLQQYSGDSSHFRIDNTGIECLPNVVAHPNVLYLPAIDTVPVCDVVNTNGCEIAWNIGGSVYADTSGDCAVQADEELLGQIKLLLSENGSVTQQVYSAGGHFSFDIGVGSFDVAVDTSGLPFNVVCPSDNQQSFTLTTSDSLNFAADFGLQCKTGYDLTAQSVVAAGAFFPADTVTVILQAGDAAQLFGTFCNTTGISGTVTASYNGPVSVLNASSNGNVSGNTVVWSISDFAQADFYHGFKINFITDTAAQANDLVCIVVTVSSSGTESNLSNNTMTHCSNVVNSYDPNYKEVYPNTPQPSSWYTYTVHFQNTGNAAAHNIVVKDTLDTNLEWSSFQLLSYSHDNQTQVKENGIVHFKFPNINLPDSTSNEPESHGWIQYKIKSKPTVDPATTTIHNTASIYFDFNAPIQTNDALVEPATGIRYVSSADFSVSPNPTSGDVTLTLGGAVSNALVVVTDITGRGITQQPVDGRQMQVQLQDLLPGTYFIRLQLDNKTAGVKKLVVIR